MKPLPCNWHIDRISDTDFNFIIDIDNIDTNRIEGFGVYNGYLFNAINYYCGLVSANRYSRSNTALAGKLKKITFINFPKFSTTINS